jgi:hypothetical protein
MVGRRASKLDFLMVRIDIEGIGMVSGVLLHGLDLVEADNKSSSHFLANTSFSPHLSSQVFNMSVLGQEDQKIVYTMITNAREVKWLDIIQKSKTASLVLNTSAFR